MKAAFVLLAAIALTGCSAVRERTYGSWLENVGKPQPAAIKLTQAEAENLRADAANLRGQAEALRMKLAREPNRVVRIEYLRQLAIIDQRLQPIERALREGGFEPPARSAPQAPPFA